MLLVAMEMQLKLSKIKFTSVAELCCIIIIYNSFFKNLQNVIFSIEERSLIGAHAFKTD